jgi:hypothetical protein
MANLWVVETRDNFRSDFTNDWHPILYFYKRITVTGILNKETEIISGVHLTRAEARKAAKEMRENNIYIKFSYPKIEYRVRKYLRDEWSC